MDGRVRSDIGTARGVESFLERARALALGSERAAVVVLGFARGE